MRAVSILLLALAIPVGSAGAQDAASEPVLQLEGHGRAEGGAVVEARLSGDAVAVTGIHVDCREAGRTLAEARGAPPSLTLEVPGEEATVNATCTAEAEGLELGATRSITVVALPEESDDVGWVFGVALGVTAAAAVAIVIAMVVASATSPVNVGVPTVEGW